MITVAVLLVLLVLAGVAGITGFGVHDSRDSAYSMRDVGRAIDTDEARG
jgi:hypothetical protein